jgi:hypothetical protein
MRRVSSSYSPRACVVVTLKEERVVLLRDKRLQPLAGCAVFSDEREKEEEEEEEGEGLSETEKP